MSDALGFLPDTKPDVAEPWRSALLQAADYIERVGWCQLFEQNGGGRVCLLGALKAVGCLNNPAALPARDALRRHLADSITGWNDAPGRTASEVTAALRACASQ